MTNGSLVLRGPRVLLGVLNPEVLTDRRPSGLYMGAPSQDWQRFLQYAVVAVGTEADPLLKPGQRVAVRQFVGEAFEQHGKVFRVAWSADVVAIIG